MTTKRTNLKRRGTPSQGAPRRRVGAHSFGKSFGGRSFGGGVIFSPSLAPGIAGIAAGPRAQDVGGKAANAFKAATVGSLEIHTLSPCGPGNSFVSKA